MIKRHKVPSEKTGNPRMVNAIHFKKVDILAGITGTWPLEVNSWMDVREVRKKYGNKLFLAGNLDKREIAKGGEGLTQRNRFQVTGYEGEQWIYRGLDHTVPLDIGLERFKEYVDYLKKNLPIS